MTKKIKIVDVIAGTEIERDMTAEELAEYEAQALAYKEQKLKEKTEAKEALLAKAAAEAKLAALGLTADDLKALGLGGN